MTKHHTLYEELYATRKENELLKEANEQLKKQIDTSQTSRLIAEKEYLRQENSQLKELSEQFKHDLQYTEHHIVNELKQQNTKLKHKNNQQEKTIDRLIKIITDEHY